MRKVVTIDLVVAKLFLIALLVLTTVAVCFSQTPVSVNGALRVSGNKIVNKNNQAVSFSGPSYFWSNTGWGAERFYNASVVNYFRSNWNAGIIRAAMGVDESGGYRSDASNKTRVKTIVDAATAAGMYVIIDWHTHHAESYQQDAVNFFKEMAQTYGTRDNVIYEIYNEPLAVSWSGTIKPYAQAVISAIRAIDPDNIIVVGTPNWSQDVDAAANDPITGYSNIAYTLHFYAATHKGDLRAKASTALSKGLALMVTEWGTCTASGSGDIDQPSTNEWVSFMKANGISNCNWSISDKNESASILNGGVSSTGAWSDNDLTASGKIVKGIVSGWGGTPPNPCTVNTLPGTIQAESFCSMSGIQTESTSDAGGGSNVGWIDAGDWLSYSINVPSSGPYTVTYRVASLSGGGTIRLEQQGGSPSYGTIAVPSTGGWQNWQTITQTIQLSAGQQNIAIAAVAGGFNLNWFGMTGGGGGFSQTIQAESYSVMSGVQTEGTSDSGGGLNVGWVDTNDWMKYPGIVIPSTGPYLVEYRVASTNGNGVLSQDLNAGATQLGTINIPNTGGWQSWQTISRTITLNAGTYDFGIFAKVGGWNINWWRISKPAGGRIASSEETEFTRDNILSVYPNPSIGSVTIHVAKPAQVMVLDAAGKSHYNAHVDEQVTIDQLKTGFYIVRMQHQTGSTTQKLIVK
jgi:endoglucanase